MRTYTEEEVKAIIDNIHKHYQKEIQGRSGHLKEEAERASLEYVLALRGNKDAPEIEKRKNEAFECICLFKYCDNIAKRFEDFKPHSLWLTQQT